MKKNSKSTKNSKSAKSAPAPVETTARPITVRDVFNNNVNRSRSHLINDALLSFGANGATAREIETKAQELAVQREATDKAGAPLIVRAVRNHLLYLLAHDRATCDNDNDGAQVWRASKTILTQVKGAKKSRKSKK